MVSYRYLFSNTANKSGVNLTGFGSQSSDLMKNGWDLVWHLSFAVIGHILRFVHISKLLGMACFLLDEKRSVFEVDHET